MTQEFLQSIEFSQYQQKIIALCAKFLGARLFGDEQDLTELKGAIELARKIIYLPVELRTDDYTKKMIAQNLKRFELDIIFKELQQATIKPSQN